MLVTKKLKSLSPEASPLPSLPPVPEVPVVPLLPALLDWPVLPPPPEPLLPPLLAPPDAPLVPFTMPAAPLAPPGAWPAAAGGGPPSEPVQALKIASKGAPTNQLAILRAPRNVSVELYGDVMAICAASSLAGVPRPAREQALAFVTRAAARRASCRSR
jgi:hypothetical protein